MQIFRKIDGVYEKMPCVADIGSCNYPDLCDLLEQLITECPPSLTAIDLTCKCPIKQVIMAGLATYFRFSFCFFKKGSCQLLAKVCA